MLSKLQLYNIFLFTVYSASIFLFEVVIPRPPIHHFSGPTFGRLELLPFVYQQHSGLGLYSTLFFQGPLKLVNSNLDITNLEIVNFAI